MKLKYLIEHYNIFYFRRKLNYKNICISLKTKNKLEAKFILATINAKLEAMREFMDFNEEIDYIKNILQEYVNVAKEEYSEFALKREQKYKYTNAKGKILLGSHPKAIDYHIEELQDELYSQNSTKIAEEIIEDSNIKDLYSKALTELSTIGKSRLIDEIIKAELELLHFDKSRNEERSDSQKLQYNYINNLPTKQLSIMQEDSSEIVQLKQETILKQFIESVGSQKDLYRKKAKEELFEEYLSEVKETKANFLDKLKLPVITLFQSTDKKYLNDYSIEDYERFFQALIYTPKNINQKKRLFIDYNENFVDIAEDFKEFIGAIEEDENPFEDYDYELELQTVKNVNEKLEALIKFLDFCKTNDYIEKNYLENNIKFSKSKFTNILEATKKRENFNSNELRQMFTYLNELVSVKDFKKVEEIYIILIALFTGMRLEEICKLKVEDIKKDENNIYYFDIIEDVKTENSKRKVPLHKYLIEKFNFLEFLNKKILSGNEMLFNLKSITRKKRIKYGHYFIRDFFNSFKDNFVSEERQEKNLITFHSYRHTFATRLKESDKVDYYDISKLLGHSIETVQKNIFNIDFKDNETSRYIHAYNLEKMQKNVNYLYLDDLESEIEIFEMKFKKRFDSFFEQ